LGVHPSKIAFLAFTKKAAHEAKERALKRFIFYEPDPLHWFNTIHSASFRLAGLRYEQTVRTSHLQELCRACGHVYKSNEVITDEGDFKTSNTGNTLVFLEHLARSMDTTLENVWEQSPNVFRDIELSVDDLRRFKQKYDLFKASSGLVDYADTLSEFVAHGATPEFDLLIVDEAQDLSSLQWQAIYRLATRAKAVIVAGDDQQAIFRWSGANVERFIALEGKLTVLQQSYRIPAKVHRLALSIAGNIKNSRPRTFHPRNVEGEVRFVDGHEEVPLKTGKWLLLARHQYQTQWLEAACREAGVFYEKHGRASNQTPGALATIAYENLRKGLSVPEHTAAQVLYIANLISYAERCALDKSQKLVTKEDFPSISFTKPWYEVLKKFPAHEPQYFRQARRGGDRMADVDEQGYLVPTQPRIRISTIHSAKGGEAESVYILTDVTASTWDGMERDISDESRVMYVGCTRAIDRLFIRRPQTNLAYDIPEIR